MFDVGFSELLMVGLVALLVLGPEKLPRAARLAGLWVGKARSVLAVAKAEIKQELAAEEMRQLMQQNIIAGEVQKALDDTRSAVEDINFNIQAATEADQHDDKPRSAG
ncbi:Sec-independent protein translocase protein TatB [Methylomonas sp. SURF-1]|uniref:Sec-independent protein translocase protein TatB n=1 Tax=Methylomonas aurea TaxID=2952224 RepID=A0ABT1UEH9_9GAMM|nr:Sec-independent protein translocase protein TatB [Methylomonas sp. SURF-1]MCQ8179811.1 Sec-independent protein translocase protein TatB [Methylomonas sp. SURF-1]